MILHNSSRISAGLMAGVIAIATIIMPAQTTFATNLPPSEIDDDGKKVTLCHRTDSVTNPYVKNTISKNAALNRAENDINGQVGVFPDTPWGDIIPAFDYIEKGVPKTFPGLNLTTGGLAILNNNCDIPKPPQPTKVTAVNGTFADECGPTFNLLFTPATTAGVTYTQTRDGDTLTVTAAAQVGYTLSNPDWTQSQTDILVPCEPTVIEIALPGVPANDPCDSGNAVYDEIPDGNYTYIRNQDGSITFTAAAGYIFANNETTATLPAPNETNTTPCHTPKPCTVSNQTFVTPWTFDEDEYPFAGAWPEDQTPATATFTEDGIRLSTPATESYTMGFIDAGNTHIKDIDAMSYRTMRESSSTGYAQTLPAYILMVDIDGNVSTNDSTYFFYEPYYNGAVVEDVWQDWNLLGSAKWYVSGTGQALKTWTELVNLYPNATVIAFGFNQGLSNEGANTLINQMVFDCATIAFVAGKGGEPQPTPTPAPTPTEIPTTPHVSVSQPAAMVAPTLVTELPTTGTRENISLLIIGVAMAALTYGAVYFAGSRRQYE